ncbi:MAG: helix-turn-helix domain-containing protein [Clostridia bacterium]|nr:helix-turn-helix domain-containing protein [Clostridia bacterium]
MNSTILKDLRLKYGYTQKEIAKVMQVSLSTYRRYEREIESIGRAPITRVLALNALYGVSSDYILSHLTAWKS